MSDPNKPYRPDLSGPVGQSLTDLDNRHWPLGVMDAALPTVLGFAAVRTADLPLPIAAALMSPFVGASLKGCATLLHESAHGRLAAKRRLNVVLGHLAGAVVLQSRRKYVKSHLPGHHARQGEAGRDPDLDEHIRLGVYEPRTRRQFVLEFMIGPLAGTSALSYWKYLLRDRVPPSLGVAVLGAAGAVLTASAIGSIPGWIGAAIFAWFLAIAYWFPMIGWFVELSEHFPMARFEVGSAATRHRACGPLSRLFVGLVGERYHLLHHLRPDIPFWNLRRAHRYLMRVDQCYAALVERHDGDRWRAFGFIRQLLAMPEELVSVGRRSPLRSAEFGGSGETGPADRAA